MKRRLSLLLVFLLGLSLVACGGSSAKIPKTQDASPEVNFVEDYLELLKTTDLSDEDLDKIRECHAQEAMPDVEEGILDIQESPGGKKLLPAYLDALQWRYLTTETLPDGTRRVVFEVKAPHGEQVDDIYDIDDAVFDLATKLQDDKFAAQYADFIAHSLPVFPPFLLRVPFDVTETDDGLKFAEDAFMGAIEHFVNAETYRLDSGDAADFADIDAPNFATATDVAAWNKLWGETDAVAQAQKRKVDAPVKDAQKVFDRMFEGLKTFDRETLANMFSEEEADAILEAFEYQPEYKDILMLFLQYIHFDYVTGFAYDDDAVRLVYEVRAPRDEIMDDMAYDLAEEAAGIEDFAVLKEMIEGWFAEHVEEYYETYPISFPAFRRDGVWDFDIDDIPGF